VGCGGAARALDRGWEAAEAAVDEERVHWELKDVLQVEERAQRARATAVKLAAGVAARGDGGAMWRSAERASAGREAAGGVLRQHVA
jgi:hypothetical protein